MTSYLKCIISRSGVRNTVGCNLIAGKQDFASCVNALNPVDQLRFILDQTLALSYFFYLYGARYHELMTQYSLVVNDYTKINLITNKYTDLDASILNIIVDMQKCWYGLDWVDVPINTLVTFMYSLVDKEANERCPVVMSSEMVIPYLMQRNRRAQDKYLVYNGQVVMPVFRLLAHGPEGTATTASAAVIASSIGSGFFYDLATKYKDYSAEFGYVRQWISSGYNYPVMLAKVGTLRYTNFDSILAAMAGVIIHTDPYVATSHDYKLCYATYRILYGLFASDFLNISHLHGILPIADVKEQCPDVRILFEMMRVFNTLYGMKMRSKKTFVRFFRQFANVTGSNDTKQIVDYVEASGTNVASAEGKAVYDRSPLGSCEAIYLISQNPVIAQDTGTDKTDNDPDGKILERIEDDEGDIDLSDLPEIDDASPALEADEKNIDDKDQDTSTDEDAEKDDSSSDEEDDDKPDTTKEKGGDKSSANPEEASPSDDIPSEPDASGDAPDATAKDTQVSGTPEDINASDLSGINFSVAPEGSETVDSVVFREELDAFITDVLVNPPKKLSPQSVNALTALQKYWLHILSVESITGILEKIISIPDKFKEIKDTKGKHT